MLCTHINELLPDDVRSLVGLQTATVEHHMRFGRYVEQVAMICEFVRNESLLHNDEVHVAIEDYATRAMGRVYDIGEYGGLLRERLWHGIPRIKFREHDPMSLKMFATDNGIAEKDEMYDAYLAQQNDAAYIDWSWVEDKVHIGKKASVRTDLVDAWFLARLAMTEYRLRRGFVRLQDLGESTIRIFNRVTKGYPTNILGRSYLGEVTK
jgi:hypothetical protein